jgi:hypothetical protein
MRSDIRILLPLTLLAGLIAASACKKKASPAAPAPVPPVPTATFTPSLTSSATSTPSRTRTPTATATRTATRTPTPVFCSVGVSPTCTPTWAVWCPGSGTVGQAFYNSGLNVQTTYTYVTRIRLDAAVSITGIQFQSTTNSGLAQQVGLYSDNGSGTTPSNLQRSATFTLNFTGTQTIDFPDILMPVGWAWLAVSAVNATDNAYSATCSNCGTVNGRIDGRMAPTAANYLANSAAPAMLANWTCP